jgi:uncharacterized protein involved in exopolysaccharide biosynthesis
MSLRTQAELSPEASLASAAPIEPTDVTLGDLLGVVVGYRWLVLSLPVLIATITIGITLSTPQQWSASAMFVPQARSSVGGGLSGLAAQFGVSVPGGDPSQSPVFYQEVVRSRAVLSAVVDSTILTERGTGARRVIADIFGVEPAEPAVRRDAAITVLNRQLDVGLAVKSGIIRVTVHAPSAEAAYVIADRLLAELIRFNLRTRQTQASAERRFTEGRLADAHADLRRAEEVLRRFTEGNRSITSPTLAVERERLAREVTLRQEVYSSLQQAFERARIDEVRDTPMISVLEQPERPVRADSRGLAAKTIGSLLGGGVLAVMIALLLHAARRAREARA